jgi:O-antigen ligase
MMTPGEMRLGELPQGRPVLQDMLSRFWALPRSDQYRRIVTLWFGVFCAGFAVFPGEWQQRWLFYLGIPLCLPAVVYTARQFARGALVWAIAAFLLYSGVSALWSGQWLTVGDEMRRVFWLGYFLLTCRAIGDFGLPYLRRALQAVLVFAALVAAYEVAEFFLTCADCGRLVGLGAHANSNVTAMIAGTMGLLGLGAAFASPGGPSLALLACQAPICALLIATGSRAALLAYLGGSLMSAVLVWRRSHQRHARRALATVLGCIGVAAVAVAALGRGWLHSEIARGDTLRLQIWSENLHRVAQRPWFGHGATTRDWMWSQSGELIGLHAHNLFLAQAYYGGAVGCALWAAVFAFALRLGWRVLQERGDFLPLVPLAFLLVVGDVDIGPVVNDVQPVWLYVWVVLGIALAYDVDLRRRAITSR